MSRQYVKSLSCILFSCMIFDVLYNNFKLDLDKLISDIFLIVLHLLIVVSLTTLLKEHYDVHERDLPIIIIYFYV